MVKDSGATVRADRLRPLNTPRPLRVETDERGRPTAVGLESQEDTGTWRRGDTAKGDDPGLRRVAPSPCLRVEEILDRWRIDDEWWRKEISRMYYHVVLEGSQLLTFFQDLTTGRWYGQTSATPPPADRAEPVSTPAFGTARASAVVDSGSPSRQAG